MRGTMHSNNNSNNNNRVTSSRTNVTRGGGSGVVVLGGRNNKIHSSTTSARSKITIKPFSKPPKLPDNYYEETAQGILKGTLQFLEQRKNSCSSSNSNSRNAISSSSPSIDETKQYSLQSAYNNTVNLVSHQYGGRLYTDLVATFHIAAERVLQQDQYEDLNSMITDNNANRGMDPDSKIMQYVVKQYSIYTDYLLLCKHVLTPLDRTWQWHDRTQKAIPIHSTSSTTSPTSVTVPVSSNNHTNYKSSSSSSMMLQNVWQVGLTCFLRRLQTLQLDQLLYQQWFASFIYDWNGCTYDLYDNDSSATNDIGLFSVDHSSMYRRQALQAVWYIWQDLGLLSQLSIQHDLEQYWMKQSIEWSTKTSSSGGQEQYPIQAFIQFCYHKHIHCYNYRQWLPILWLWNVLDTFLFQPHLIVNHDNGNCGSGIISSSSTISSQLTPLLLREENLFPVLQDAIQQQKHVRDQQPYTSTSSSSSSSSSWSTIQMLWMLAGRLHGGQKVLANSIQRFARSQGLQCVQVSTSNIKSPNGSVAATAPSNVTTKVTNVNAVQDLLQLQDSLTSMIQSLPMTTSPTAAQNNSNGGGGLVLLPKNASSNYTSSSSSNNIISLKSVWEEVVNVDTEPSIAEQLAKFLDSILKSNKKIDQYQNQATTSAMMNQQQQAASAASTLWLHRIVMGLFVPLAAKDVFEAFYKKDLAKRLLWNRVVSMDIEKQVCSLLKAECGAGYTSKMEGMFQDIEWSRETMAVYKESTMMNYNNNATNTTSSGSGTDNANSSNNNESSQDDATMNDVIVTTTTSDGKQIKSVEMEVQILTTGYWPVYPQFPNLQLPMSFQIPQMQFTNHYKTKYQGRRMTWQYALGHCTVRAIGFNKPYDLVVSLCQALTLLQFTNKDIDDIGGGWTLPNLQRAIGLDDRDEMERILQSLALGKDGTRILRKIDFDRDSAGIAPPPAGTPMKKQPLKKIRMNVDDKDKFIINNNFDSSVRRIRINNILMKETKEEHDKTVEGISRDRLYLIDAVLVRIMKARKTILHQQLIPQVLEQIKVPALPADVKKRIESLIEREYMERDSKERNRYNYLA